MPKALILLLFSAFSLQAQTAVPQPSATPVNTFAESAKSAADADGKAEKTKKETAGKVKTGKSPVTVSPRFAESLPPEKLNPMAVPRLTTAPTIDGKLDDDAWKTAAVFKDFYQTSPGDNIAPSKPTLAYMMYDAENIYFAFHCFDEPDKIRATVAKRDEIFNEDNVRIYLDTYDDQLRAYVLGFNPLGIQQDGIYTESQGADFSVDIVMESKGVIVADGWTVEIRIPFKSLRYTAGKDKFWGVQLWRNIDRFNDEVDSWMPRDLNMPSLLSQEGKVTGFENIKVERTIELVPNITISETGSRKRTMPISLVDQNGFDPLYNPFGLTDRGRFVNDGLQQELGLNLKFNITPNITLDAAINPDFAEIEADAPVVTANQRFPIFFQEKRPFFLEGAEIFQSPTRVFYSRTIIDPDLATKLTGKIGKTSFGLLAASDNAPGNYSDDERTDPDENYRPSREFLDKNALFGVVRVKRDFGKQNNVGFFGTARIFPRNRNFVAGFDGRFQLDSKKVMQFQILGTHSRKNFYDPIIDRSRYRSGNGIGYVWNLDYTEKNRGYYVEASGRSQNFRTDAGFTRRVNTNTVQLFQRLSTEPAPKAKIIRTNWNQFASINYDWKGRSQDLNAGTNLNFSFQRNTYASIETGVAFERIFETEFGAKRSATQSGAFVGEGERSTWQHYINSSFNTAPSKRLSFGAFGGFISNAFDFDFGAGSRFNRVSPAFLTFRNDYADYLRRFGINPNDPTNIKPASARLDPQSGKQFDVGVNAEVKPIDPLRISFEYNKSHLTRGDTNLIAYDSNIFTVRSTYQFTRFTFVRARWDYNSIASNASGQFLVGYNPNPGTAFYVGYNDNFNYNGFSPFTGQLEPRFERNSRTFFIRASYLFRKSF